MLLLLINLLKRHLRFLPQLFIVVHLDHRNLNHYLQQQGFQLLHPILIVYC
jgi:tRNA(His) 5'-end guanylyltransferase